MASICSGVATHPSTIWTASLYRANWSRLATNPGVSSTLAGLSQTADELLGEIQDNGVGVRVGDEFDTGDKWGGIHPVNAAEPLRTGHRMSQFSDGDGGGIRSDASSGRGAAEIRRRILAFMPGSSGTVSAM